MRTLLMVDDEPEILMIAELALKRHWRVLTARSAEEALSLLAAEPVDVLVTDQRMPGMSGIGLIRRARADRPAMPCLLSTGYTPDGEMLEAIHDLGVDGVIHKPWSPRELHAMIMALPELTH